MNTPVLLGALLGLLGGIGLILALLGSPVLRRRSLADRIAPYISDTPPPSRLLTGPEHRGVLAHLAGPLMREAAAVLDRLVGGRSSVQRRLAALGTALTVEQFRIEQLLYGAAGAGAGLLLAGVGLVTGQRNVLLLVLLILVCALGGVLARDWRLSRAVASKDAAMLAEFPVIAELLALAVTAGEAPLAALDRVSKRTAGTLAQVLAGLVAETRAGRPLVDALTAARDRTQLEALARFLDGMVIAIERGTPMADVLRAQAADVRAIGKRRLLEAGGRKEIAMMVPVVFILLPLTILFALYPGLIVLTSVAR